MLSATSALNKKALTNLYEESQMRVTLFEPIAPATHDLGSPEYQWGDVYVNRIVQSQAPIEVYIPSATSGTGSPPATKALNNDLDFYIQLVSSSNFTVYKFISPNQSVVIQPTEGALFFSVTTNAIYLKTATQWLRSLINNN